MDEQLVEYGKSATEYSYSPSSDMQYIKTFSKWVNKETGADVTSFVITSNVSYKAVINTQEINYSFNIAYEDKDNILADNNNSSFGTATASGTYNSNISLKKQAYKSTLFYMSPVDTLTNEIWSAMNASGVVNTSNNFNYLNSDNELLFIANITNNASTCTGVINILVLCVQPAAIVSTNNAVELNESSNYESYTFYTNVSDAIIAASSNSTAEYIRVYGQGRLTIKQNAYLPTETVTIASRGISFNNVTFTVPQYTLNNYDNYALKMNNYVSNNTYTLKANDKLILPYVRNDSTSDGYTNYTGDEVNAGANYVHSYMIIPNNVTLNTYGILTIGGQYGDKGNNVALPKASLMNNGYIHVYSGAQVNSYGYIKGEFGTLELDSGSTLIDLFRMYDYHGGQNALGMVNNNFFPINVYSFHNVSCNTIINYGSIFKVKAFIVDKLDDFIVLLGDGGLFELSDSSGFFVKKVEDTTKNTNINKIYDALSQDVTQREVIEIYGDFQDNSVSMTIADLKEVKTSANMPMPFGLMRVEIVEGTGTMSSSSYKFLPGAEFIIHEKAQLNIASGISIVFYDTFAGETYKYTEKTMKSSKTQDPCNYSYKVIHSSWYSNKSFDGTKVIVNGKLVSDGNLSGVFQSNAKGQIISANTSTSIPYMKQLDYKWYNFLTGSSVTKSTSTLNAYGLNSDGSTISFTKGISYTYDNGKWV